VHAPEQQGGEAGEIEDDERQLDGNWPPKALSD